MKTDTYLGYAKDVTFSYENNQFTLNKIINGSPTLTESLVVSYNAKEQIVKETRTRTSTGSIQSSSIDEASYVYDYKFGILKEKTVTYNGNIDSKYLLDYTLTNTGLIESYTSTSTYFDDKGNIRRKNENEMKFTRDNMGNISEIYVHFGNSISGTFIPKK